MEINTHVEPSVQPKEPVQIKTKSKQNLASDEKNVSDYIKGVMPELPKGFMKNNPARSINFVVALVIIGLGATALIQLQMTLFEKLGLSLVMGFAFTANAFLAHEALHGSMFKGKFLQDLVGFIGFAGLFNAPTFWRHEHNVMHHGNTQKLLIDPDAFPTLRIFKTSKYAQRTYKFMPGSNTLRSLFYFFYWFTFHNLMAQTYFRFRNNTYKGVNHTRCTVELLGQTALVVAYGWVLGPENLVWGMLIPFLMMNYTLMSYISTNHNFLPLVRGNDPLKCSLSVTNHPILEFLHMNFGYHTEHHLMPKMCMSKAKTLHKVLKAKFPNDYKVMSKAEAVKRLYTTPRIYKNRTTLVDPFTGETKPTY